MRALLRDAEDQTLIAEKGFCDMTQFTATEVED